MTLHRPWSSAVPRLLRERGLKGIDLVEHGGLKRQGTLSAVINSPTTPKLATLLTIAQAIERAERVVHGRAHPAPVETWEFFVSDEQSALLREHAAHRAKIATPTSDDERDYAEFKRYQEWKRREILEHAEPIPRAQKKR